VVSGLLLALSGCSNAESESNGFDQSGTTGLTGDGDSSEDTGGTDGGPTGESDGGEDEDSGAEGPSSASEERGITHAQCDASAEQIVSYDLAEAQAELAPVLVRENVLFGAGKVPQLPLTAQPFLNHFKFHYPPATSWDPEISGELWKPPVANADAPSRYRLQFAIRGPQVGAAQRDPVDLVIVVDLGPNMLGEPLELAEAALAAVEAALVPGDRVTLIGAGKTPVIIGASTIIDAFGQMSLTGLLDGTSPAGVADVAGALELAYETVDSPWDGQGQARVLLVSNGHFQVNGALVNLVEDHAGSGHYLVSLGVGAPELFADAPLRELAAQGRGPLLYARTAEELLTNVHERFTAHMLAAATDIQISLMLPPGLAIRVRDELPPKLGDPEQALLGPNDLLVFHHELELCGELAEDAVVVVALEWVDPLIGVAKQTIWEQPVAELGFGSKDTRKGAATVAYVRALRGYRDGKLPSANYGAVLDAISLIADALGSQPYDLDLIEMSTVLGKLEN